MSKQIQAQFVRSAKKPGCEMIKVIIPGRNLDGEWADCSPDVRIFAGKAFVEKELTLLTVKDSFENNRYQVERIEKINTQTTQAAQSTVKPVTNSVTVLTQQATQPTNTQTVTIAPPKNYMNPKTPKESAQILRLSTYASACEAVKALTGQVDPNNICDIIDVIYKRGVNVVKG